jgi:hypothetical protein
MTSLIYYLTNGTVNAKFLGLSQMKITCTSQMPTKIFANISGEGAS